METEKKLREYEELRTIDDYIQAYQDIADIAVNFSGASDEVTKYFSETLLILSKSFKKKIKYIVNGSRKWRRRQSLFSKYRDYLAEKQEQKIIKQKLENERLLVEMEKFKSKSVKSEETQKDEQNISSPASEAVVLSETKHKPIEVTNEDKESAVLDF